MPEIRYLWGVQGRPLNLPEDLALLVGPREEIVVR
jgi:hypothetical protein